MNHRDIKKIILNIYLQSLLSYLINKVSYHIYVYFINQLIKLLINVIIEL